MNLAGIKRILELELENRALRVRADDLLAEVNRLHAEHRSRTRVFAAHRDGDIVAVPPGRRPARTETSTALVVWRPER